MCTPTTLESLRGDLDTHAEDGSINWAVGQIRNLVHQWGNAGGTRFSSWM